MQDRFMEFCAEVRHVGGSSGFRLLVPPTVPSPINVAPPEDVAMEDYNSADDSDYDGESSCHSMEEDEDVPNTPSVRGPRLVLPAPLPIPNLSEARRFFRNWILIPRMQRIRVWSVLLMSTTQMGELSSEWGTECKIDRHRVSMDDSNCFTTELGILGGPKDRWSPHLFGPCDSRGSLLARQHIDDKCGAADGQDKSIGFGSIIAECCPAELSFQAIVQKSVDGQEESDGTIVRRF
ncbi:hypothetical protein PIB30_046187 [Stylosanthes scabra]|uniref:Uncharacterized protein n=1 Tax=Stylosanthes scabra TaxID=79078 RepID=A0ABU6XF75_9FABA|nr:hypothetical protein [Stylosanthes scabra]